MQGGRTRWHIENDTFNTLKNQGYQFDHNFGHGKQNLSVVLAFLMFTAFLIDQIQEFACKHFQAALKTVGRLKYLTAVPTTTSCQPSVKQLLARQVFVQKAAFS